MYENINFISYNKFYTSDIQIKKIELKNIKIFEHIYLLKYEHDFNKKYRNSKK